MSDLRFYEQSLKVNRLVNEKKNSLSFKLIYFILNMSYVLSSGRKIIGNYWCQIFPKHNFLNINFNGSFVHRTYI